MVAILEKSDATGGFEQIIDFLSGSYIHHALTVNPNVYISCIKQFWNTVVVKRSGDITRLQALVDKKRIVLTKEVVHEILQLNDADGVICLPNDEIFAGLARMGYEKPSTKLTFYKAFFSTQWKFFIHTILHSLSAKRTSWNEFSSAMASALIYFSSGQGFNFSKYIFESLVRNVDSSSKFYMVGKGFLGVETPLFETMLAVRDIAEEAKAQIPAQDDDVQEHAEEEVATNVVSPTPTSPSPSSPGRISVDIETDEGVKLVVDQEKNAEVEGRQADKQAEIYNIDLDHSSKVLSMQEDDIEVAAASIPISAAKPKVLKIAAAPAISTKRRKGVVIRDPEEELHTNTPAETLTVKDKGKGILIKDPKPMKKKDQVEMDAEEEMEKEDEEIIKSINETPAQKAAKRRKLSEEAQEADDLRRRLEIVQDEDDDVFVEAIPLAQKVPVVDYQVVVIDNKPRYKIIRADDTHQFYISFTTLLKNFDREDLETL
uniref:Synaptobrevin, longin-like domain protein n=1 Tax=Tanacetum cinerariifolium TaxID=118510 RepID=A0A699IDE0_TANCI|nr:hypothetical protein [Tanacetum cinerariifolium]